MDLTLLENLRSKLGLSPMGKPALVGLAALLIMVAVTAGRTAIETATATEIQLERTVQEASDPETIADSAEDEGNDMAADTRLFVHVSGAVQNPGLVELPLDSRVADAIEAAGGALDDANFEAVNLARKIQDGEHVHLPTLSEAASGQQGSQTFDTGLDVELRDKVNVNLASAEELEELPGIGPSIAKRIVADRESSGPFESPEDLKRVTGIGDKKLAGLIDLVCV